MSVHEYIALRARELGIEPDRVYGKRGRQEVVYVRTIIAAELRGEPWKLSYPKIGKVLNRHHTSVLSLLKGGKGHLR